MTRDPDDVVTDVLGEHVGKFIARGIVQKACEDAGLDPENLDWDDIDDLADPLEERLSIQIGEDNAGRIVDGLRDREPDAPTR